MIKLFKFFLLIIMIVVGLVGYVLYTPSGKNQISSMLSEKVSQSLGYDIDLNVKEIALSLTSIETTIEINKALNLKIIGSYSPWSHQFDVDYHLLGEKIVYAQVSFDDSVDIYGKIVGIKENFHLQATGKALDGEVDFSLQHLAKSDKDIKIDLKNVSSKKSSLLWGEKPLLAGKVSLDADIPLYSNFEKKGTILCTIHRSGVYLQEIKEQYGILLPDDFMVSGKLDIALESGQHHFAADVNSTLGEMQLSKGSYIEANKKLHAYYQVDIKELSKLTFLTKKKFVGSFSASGELEYQKNLRLDGMSRSLDGEINYYYEKRELEASLKDVSLEKLLIAMHYPPIMIGEISGKVDYDIAENMALLNLRSQKLHIKRTPLTKKIFAVSGVDFAEELFTHATFASSIEDGVVSYDFKAENSASSLSLFNAKMDAKKNTIRSDFEVKMQGEELSGEIYGSLKSPKVELDIGKYVEFKAKKEIDAFFGQGTSAKVKKKLKEVDVEDVKGFIKGFF